jgi:cytosine/adenosine deaminase-related metal-dependent hydrolase
MSLLLRNANSLSWDQSAEDFALHTGHLLLDNNCITHIPAGDQVPTADNELDLGHRLVTAPLVNCHHHFYSLPARGLVPEGTTNDFSAVLENLWWKLDRALTLEAIRLAARQSTLESIQQGVLTIFDHHASPEVTEAALSSIGTEVERYGLRAVLCHEISDRNGAEVCEKQFSENRNFIASCQQSRQLKGIMGLHASFTVSDATLASVAGERIHIHLAEDPVDNELSQKLYGDSACNRLSVNGLLQPGSILAHGNHLSESELNSVAESGSTLVHNPHSNMNNGVGTLDLTQAITQGCRIAPGTDGMHSSIASTLKQAFLLLRHTHRDPTIGFAAVQALVKGMFQLGRQFFPRLPLLQAGDSADLVVWDYQPLTPLRQENLWGHFIYGLLESKPKHVVANGDFLLKDGDLILDDVSTEHAQAVMSETWENFYRV